MAKPDWQARVPCASAKLRAMYATIPALTSLPLPDAEPAAALRSGKRVDAVQQVDADKVLRVPVLLMKCVFLWPDSQNAVTRFISKWVLPAFLLEFSFASCSFLAQGQFDSGIAVLVSFGDILVNFVVLLKLLLLSREGPRLARIRRQLQTGFSAMEGLAEPEASAANSLCTNKCYKISKWFAYGYVPFCLSFMAINIENAFDPPEERRFTFSTPRAFLENDYIFWTMLPASVLVSITFFFYSVGYDTLYLSLCLHISCKCDILKIILRRAALRPAVPTRFDLPATKAVGEPLTEVKKPTQYKFEYWRDDGSPWESASRNGLRDGTQENFRTCVQYHNKIIQLRNEMEDIFAGVTLWQMFYILLGLGVPALRILREGGKPGDIVFQSMFIGWNFSQLLFYCWFADVLAESSGAVADAANAALRPAEDSEEAADRAVVNLSKTAGFTLRFITLRAQKPLHLTAGNIFNVTLELYLTEAK